MDQASLSVNNSCLLDTQCQLMSSMSYSTDFRLLWRDHSMSADTTSSSLLTCSFLDLKMSFISSIYMIAMHGSLM